MSKWWELYDDRGLTVNYPRRDDAPVARVGTTVTYVKGVGFVSKPIHVFTTRRPWPFRKH